MRHLKLVTIAILIAGQIPLQLLTPLGLRTAHAQSLPQSGRSLPPNIARSLLSRLEISEAALQAIAQIVASDLDIPNSGLIDRVTSLAEEAANLRAELKEAKSRLDELPPSEQAKARNALDRAETLLDAGDFEGAEVAFAEIAHAAKGRAEEENGLWERAIDAQATAARLRGDFNAERQIRRDARDIIRNRADRAEWVQVMAEANAWYEEGRLKGRKKALEAAIALYKNEALPLRSRENAPLDWAATHNNLGNALSDYGEHESDAERLEEAVKAFQNALKENTRERVPSKWAATQNNLGKVLWTLGSRETSTARLEQAVTAYRNALQEQTRLRAPFEWATTQNNLGLALWTLGLRESGKARLEKAVTAFQNSLKVRTREHEPILWASAQSNLGNVFISLSHRERYSKVRLEAAVSALENALKEQTRESVPLDWAKTQNSLGSALYAIGAREFGKWRLEKAVRAYENASKVLTREQAPYQWATTKNNLGLTFVAIGFREVGTAHLEKAVSAYRSALEERTRERLPLDWAATQHNWAMAEMAFAYKNVSPKQNRVSAIKRLRAAESIFRQGRSIYDADESRRLIGIIEREIEETLAKD